MADIRNQQAARSASAKAGLPEIAPCPALVPGEVQNLLVCLFLARFRRRAPVDTRVNGVHWVDSSAGWPLHKPASNLVTFGRTERRLTTNGFRLPERLLSAQLWFRARGRDASRQNRGVAYLSWLGSDPRVPVDRGVHGVHGFSSLTRYSQRRWGCGNVCGRSQSHHGAANGTANAR
jgi:hypothetical protein